MRTVYKAKNTSVTPALHAYMEEKIEAMAEKLIGADNEAALLEIELTLETKHHRKGDIWHGEANLTLGKKMIRAVESGEDPYAVIDEVASELARELKSFKGKNQTKNIRGARVVKQILKKTL